MRLYPDNEWTGLDVAHLRAAYDNDNDFFLHVSTQLRANLLFFETDIVLPPDAEVVLRLDVPGKEPRILRAQVAGTWQQGESRGITLRLADDQDYITRMLELPSQSEPQPARTTLQRKKTVVMSSPLQEALQLEGTNDVLLQQLETALANLHKADYYTRLGLSPGLELEALHERYGQLHATYHPARIPTGGKQVKALADEVMKLINEAYDTLSNPEARARYNIAGGLYGPAIADEPDGAITELYVRFERARNLLQEGKIRQAFDHLTAVVQQDRSHPKFLAYFGWLVHRLENPRGRGVLEEAVRLDPECEEAHEFLARVLKENKEYSQAKFHFMEAYRLNPARVAAYREFEAIEQSEQRRR